MTRRPAGFTVLSVVFAIVAALSMEQLVAPIERVLGVVMSPWWPVLLAVEAALAVTLTWLVWRMHPLALRVYVAWGALVIVMAPWYQHAVALPLLAFLQELGYGAPDRIPLMYEIASGVLNAIFVWLGFVYLAPLGRAERPLRDAVVGGAP